MPAGFAGEAGEHCEMIGFYRKAIASFIGLLVFTALLAYIGFASVTVTDALLPADESTIRWKAETITDSRSGGASSITVVDDVYSLDFEYFLTGDIQFPHVFAIVAFSDPRNPGKPADLGGYSRVTFRVKCSTRNVLEFYVHSFDRLVTDPADFHSYRIASAIFSCHDEWSPVEIDLKHLKVPRWWLDEQGVDISDQDYAMDKVIALSFVGSWQGPKGVPVAVKIGKLSLHGRDWRYFRVLAGFVTVVWMVFVFRLFRLYTASLVADVENRLKKDRPLMAYKKLSIAPHRDKEKNQLLRFMAAEYTNPEMSLEYAVTALGINRTKINELLKDELGMTFGNYLNKLRLAEAARLLSRQDGANVAEIARMVGYVNASYFNKLFKAEYGCTPGAFIGVNGNPAAD